MSAARSSFNAALTVKRTIVVDDNELVRRGIRSVLESRQDIDIVGEAEDQSSALQLIADTNPHLAILDLVLGNDDGVALVKKCHTLFPKLRILVTTVQDERIYAERVIRGGADGFLSKSDAIVNLSEAIDTIFAGELYISNDSNSRILGHPLLGRTSTRTEKVSALSDRELHVFNSIGAGFGTSEIAASLGLSPKTIETYRENIKAKLELKNADQLKTAAKLWTKPGTDGEQTLMNA